MCVDLVLWRGSLSTVVVPPGGVLIHAQVAHAHRPLQRQTPISLLPCVYLCVYRGGLFLFVLVAVDAARNNSVRTLFIADVMSTTTCTDVGRFSFCLGFVP